jgi:hypothetical protein
LNNNQIILTVGNYFNLLERNKEYSLLGILIGKKRNNKNKCKFKNLLNLLKIKVQLKK